jgi:hypothetical protein|tara:strand:+ start:1012 stop:1314 length:303 start_codon:yes stop_codon:yes gene_type:complete
MNFKRLLGTDVGKAFISFIIGIGIATIFRKVCKDGECITFKGPILSQISDDKIFKHNNSCFSYKLNSNTCMDEKKTLHIDPPSDDEKKDSVKPFSFLTNS